MSEPDEMDEDSRWFADDPDHDDDDSSTWGFTEEDCGRWMDGKLTRSCRLLGTEDCDFECPLRSSL